MKKYVRVTFQDLGDGVVRPQVIHWEDGRAWTITEVIRVIPRYPFDYDRFCKRYEISIGDYETALYRDKDGWFVDTKE